LKVKNIIIEWNTRSILNLIQFFYYKIFGKILIDFFSPIKKYNKTENYNFSKKKYNTKVLVKSISCGLCATDIKLLSLDFSFFSSIFLYSSQNKEVLKYLGHETIGKVVETGKNVKDIKKNDFVIIDAIIRDKKKIKNDRYAGFCKYFIKDEKHLVKVSGRLSPKISCLIEPISCSFAIFKKIKNFNKNSKILIVGSGIIGFALYKILQYYNVNKKNIAIYTKNNSHKEILKKEKIKNIIFNENIFEKSKKFLGTEIKKNLFNKILVSGYDYIFDCSGNNKVLNEIIYLANSNATIVLAGLNLQKISVDPVPLWHKNISILTSHGYDFKYKDLKFNTMNFIEKLLVTKKIKINEQYITEVDGGGGGWKDLFKNDKSSLILKKILKF